MNKERFKQYRQRYSRWQQDGPHYVNRHEGELRQCHNCGTEFADNFCPRCGQRFEAGRVGWNTIRENITILWGLDSRSLTNTLVQLLTRPGYLVRDYISGRRQVSFPPVKMLVIVCLFVVLFETVFHVKNDVLTIKFHIQKIDEVVAWINSQKSWATLLVQSIYILPTWVVFRFAPGYPRHTLPEGFFLQVFLSVQNLLLGFFGYWNQTVELVLCIVYMYVTYCQLFGYGRWSSLWRVAVVLILQLLVMATIIMVVILCTYNDADKSSMAQAFMLLLTVAVVLMTVILYVTHLINKRTFRKQQKDKENADDVVTG